MTRPADPDPKQQALARHRTLHPHPDKVTDDLFRDQPFFDPRDATQVKYEMLRRVQVDGVAVVDAARSFGMSRPTFYEAREAFESAGMAGLLPRKKGPRRAHKLSAEVMAWVAEALRADPSLSPAGLAQRIEERFCLRVHPRSVQRALGRLPGKA